MNYLPLLEDIRELFKQGRYDLCEEKIDRHQMFLSSEKVDQIRNAIKQARILKAAEEIGCKKVE